MKIDKISLAKKIGMSAMALACMAILPTGVNAQAKKEVRVKMPVPPPPPPLPVNDRVPQFPGGPAKWAEYLKKNLKYPAEAKKNNVAGNVILSFFVENDGNLNDLSVAKGIGSGCDQEALRLLRGSPKWQPAIKNSSPVRQKVTLPITFALPGTKSTGLKPPPPPVDKEVYSTVEESGEFPGGIDAFYKYLAKNIKYPATARNANVQGKVYLTFVIETNGVLSDIKVLRGIGSGCDEEAIRVVKNSPKWKPGKESGKAVRQQYTVPISFNLAKN